MSADRPEEGATDDPARTGRDRTDLTPVLERLLAEEPVLVINGACAVGKSTTLRALADMRGAPVFDLDDLTMRNLAARDPQLVTGAPG